MKCYFSRMRPRPRAVPSALLFALALVCAGALGAGAPAAAKKPKPAIGAAPRVVAARKEHDAGVRAAFAAAGVPYPAPALFIRVFKKDAVLELWGGKRGAPLALVKAYDVCAASGELGPKRREGDFQVPEGFYRITHLNPYSDYHLAMGIDYPNAADRIVGYKPSLGGAILIHGSCVTVGCIPITDEPIEEVFLAVLDARTAGLATVPVHIFPTRMDDAGMTFLKVHAGLDATLRAFWDELKPAYDAFEKSHLVPRVTVEKSGRYVVHPLP